MVRFWEQPVCQCCATRPKYDLGHQYDGISLVDDVFADLVEMKLHRFGIGLRQEECGQPPWRWSGHLDHAL